MSKIIRDLTEDELNTVAGAGKLADAAGRGAIAGAVGAASGPPLSTIEILQGIYEGNQT